MGSEQDQPDPELYIDRLADSSPLHREAAAWTLGEIGSPRAARPLAGLLLRELSSVERSGRLHHTEVVSAVVEAIRRLGATEALYALVRALHVLSRARSVEEGIVVEIVDTLGEVGGPNAMCEAANRVLRGVERPMPGMRVVASVMLPRLGLCGDAAVRTLRRLANGGPESVRPVARHVFGGL